MRHYKSGSRWALWRWSIVDSDYIRRLHVFKTPWFALCVHFLRTPDPEPYLHDHPVTFLSLIVRGGYVENRNGVSTRRRWFNWVRANPNDRHTITHVDPGTVTVAFMGPKTREWGFHLPDSPRPDGWVMWKPYYAAKRKGVQL